MIENYFKSFVDTKEIGENISEPSTKQPDNLPYMACHWQGQTELSGEFLSRPGFG